MTTPACPASGPNTPTAKPIAQEHGRYQTGEA
jgi:hypothetical protein